MGKFSTSASGVAGAIKTFVAANRASDYIVERRLVSQLRKYIGSKSQLGLGLSPAEQTIRLTEFLATPQGLKYLAHFRKSSYNSFAGSLKLLYRVLTHV